jgi:hypothetical protein
MHLQAYRPKFFGYFHQVLKFGLLELASISISDGYIRVVLS